MKKFILAGLLACCMLLSACGQAAPAPSHAVDTRTIAATTYPVYLFTTAVTQGVEGVTVELVVNQQSSCLHDYTLTVNDMKCVEAADVIVMNGAGLEDFMSDALSASAASVIDCSAGLTLLPYEGHEEHDHGEDEGGHFDPHIWMDPTNAAAMVENIVEGLSAADPANQAAYEANSADAVAQLTEAAEGWHRQLADRGHLNLITFHDGFRYFAAHFDLTLLKAIEEEEGSEASAQDIKEIVALIGQYQLPAIFTEVNGSTATADAIARETGVKIYPLSMIMSGEGSGLQPYLDVMQQNIDTLMEAL